MLTCREVLDFVMAYVDGELSSQERGEFERHLSICSPCVDYLASYRRTMELERQAYDAGEVEAVSQAIPEELVQAILASRKKS